MTTIAIAQTTSTDDLAHNLHTAHSFVREAAAAGARLIAFPEVFLYVGRREGKLALAESLEGRTVSEFRETAARHSMMILLGSLHERIADDPSRVYNTSVLLAADGAILASYRKQKLFDLELPHLKIKESDTIAPGREMAPVVDTPIGRLGLTICFDIRFSDIYLDLRRRGAELVFVPSNFTVPTGTAHWETLLRARAIEGQFYVAAPAQCGRHNEKYTSFGNSMLVDPWGRVTALAPPGPGLVYGEFDAGEVHAVRARLPMGAP
ncbi:MAG: carbon-nitrogen hydrolase family protein [Gammaproteobacteria bacterium]|nr:carbon-nitrogen hydrolase family protein [Gammaproteobacteria bacterium]